MSSGLKTFAALYVACGLVVSSLLAYATPATSLAGRAYLVAIWPAMVGAGSFGTPTPPIPAWCFSFKPAGRQALKEPTNTTCPKCGRDPSTVTCMEC